MEKNLFTVGLLHEYIQHNYIQPTCISCQGLLEPRSHALMAQQQEMKAFAKMWSISERRVKWWDLTSPLCWTVTWPWLSLMLSRFAITLHCQSGKFLNKTSNQTSNLLSLLSLMNENYQKVEALILKEHEFYHHLFFLSDFLTLLIDVISLRSWTMFLWQGVVVVMVVVVVYPTYNTTDAGVVVVVVVVYLAYYPTDTDF